MSSGKRGVFHWDSEKQCIVDGPAPTRPPDRMRISKRGDEGGISFQIPPGWDDGSGKIRHVKGGIHDGRVCWSTQAEAREVAARLEAKEGSRVRYDPQ